MTMSQVSDPVIGRITPDAGSDGAMRFDRRGADRQAIEGRAQAFECGGEGFGRTHDLRLIDYSPIGVAAICDTVLTPGTAVTVGLEPIGGGTRRGVVTRCLPCGNGYRVAIRFEQRLAA